MVGLAYLFYLNRFHALLIKSFQKFFHRVAFHTHIIRFFLQITAVSEHLNTFIENNTWMYVKKW